MTFEELYRTIPLIGIPVTLVLGVIAIRLLDWQWRRLDREDERKR